MLLREGIPIFMLIVMMPNVAAKAANASTFPSTNPATIQLRHNFDTPLWG